MEGDVLLPARKRPALPLQTPLKSPHWRHGSVTCLSDIRQTTSGILLGRARGVKDKRMLNRVNLVTHAELDYARGELCSGTAIEESERSQCEYWKRWRAIHLHNAEELSSKKVREMAQYMGCSRWWCSWGSCGSTIDDAEGHKSSTACTVARGRRRVDDG